MRNRSDNYLAERFSAAVDRQLKSQGLTEEISNEDEFAELLGLSAQLANFEFGAARPIRHRLRSELLVRYREKFAERRPRGKLWLPPALRPLSVGLITLVLGFVLILVNPVVRTYAQEAWQSVLNSVHMIRTLPKLGVTEPEVRSPPLKFPAEAAALVEFPVYLPQHLPLEYQFRYGHVVRAPTQTVWFHFGPAPGRIFLLSDGRAMSGASLRGINFFMTSDLSTEPWPIGEALVEAVQVGGKPALWLQGLPVIQQQTSITTRVTSVDGELIEQETLAIQESPPTVIADTEVNGLFWESEALLFGLIDSDGRFSWAELQAIAESLIPVTALEPMDLPSPTPQSVTEFQTLPDIAALVQEAQFSPYVITPLPAGWELDRVTGFYPSAEPLEWWYVLQYRNAAGGRIRLREGLNVALFFWENDIVRAGGRLRHTTSTGVEVWTAAAHQDNVRLNVLENSAADSPPQPEEVQAMYLHFPDGFSVEYVAIGLSWEAALDIADRLILTPGADPALNSRLMKGCYPCP